MKLIVRYILFIFAIISLVQCEKEDPYPYVKITDNNFLNALIEFGFDKDGDSLISYDEASLVTELYLYDASPPIDNMDGIEAFVNLKKLYCNSNNLTSLDVSKNTLLTILNCQDNLISNLDISNNTDLTYLNCLNNHLATLDVSKDTLLTILKCQYNLISNLDISI